MLNVDDFIIYSSYTNKIYMKNMGGSGRNSIVEKLAFLGPRPHRKNDVKILSKFCVFRNEDPISASYIYFVS